MRTTNYLDLAPYRRSTVGFDRLFDFMNSAGSNSDDGYPPYDIERLDEDSYRITLAVAGFRPDEIEIVAQQNLMTISGKKAEDEKPDKFIHRGIARRSFERRFQLVDFVQVKTAEFANGLLTITLQREVPEAMKPRKIEIASNPAGSGEQRATENAAA